MTVPRNEYKAGDRFETSPGWIEVTALVDGTSLDAEPSFEWRRNDDNTPYRHWTFPFGYFPMTLNSGEKFESGERKPITVEVLNGKVLVEGSSKVAPEASDDVKGMIAQVKRGWRSENEDVNAELVDLRRMSGFDDSDQG